MKWFRKNILGFVLAAIVSFTAMAIPLIANADAVVRVPDGRSYTDDEWFHGFVQSFFEQEVSEYVARRGQGVRSGGQTNWSLTNFAVILEDRSLWLWGQNHDGRLGDGTTQPRSTPFMLFDSVFSTSHIWHLGNFNGMGSVLRYDGTLWRWGDNRYGWVGDGTTIDRYSPVLILDDVVWTRNWQAALRADGTLWAWGPMRGAVGDGVTDRLVPEMILDDIVLIADNFALRSDNSLWAWGYFYNGYIQFDASTPVMLANYFIAPLPEEEQRFIADDGTSWHWRGFIGVYENGMLRPTDVELSILYTAQYTFENMYIYNVFPQGYNILVDISDFMSASAEILYTISVMRPPHDMLNIATLYIENVARRGTSQAMPSDGRLSATILANGVDTASQLRQNTYNTLIAENFTLMRRLRTNINFISEETQGLYIAFPDNISAIPFDNVTIESEFAAVTINHNHIRQGGEIIIRRVPMPAQTQTASNLTGSINAIIHPPMALAAISAMAATPSEGILSRLVNFWSIPIIALIIVGWLVLASRGVKIKTWIAPTLTVVLVCANVGTFILSGSDGTIATHNEMETSMIYAIEVTMTEGMRATISLPANGDNPEFLIMFNEHGELQHSKYNPVTGNIDANIRENGIYFLREQSINFADIDAMHQRMQDSIRRLAARDIIRGTDGGYFHPNDLITRAEFIAAIVMAFDMLDFNAQTSFIDLSPSDWFYHAIATAENEGLLIAGFDDNTFRGMSEMPKDQLIVVAANTLMERMGYFVPSDIERYLMLFLDRSIFEEWSEDGIALATSSNIVMFRMDSLFAPQSIKTRGDAAIVLYNVFSRVW